MPVYNTLLSRLTIEEESTPDFTQNHHGCLVTSNGLPANDFLYLPSETVINVILTKFVCCADSDLLYILKLSPFYLALHFPVFTESISLCACSSMCLSAYCVCVIIFFRCCFLVKRGDITFILCCCGYRPSRYLVVYAVFLF